MTDRASESSLADLGHFATMRWTVVLAAGAGEDSRAQDALSYLLSRVSRISWAKHFRIFL
jgi:hypothetical protein